MPGANSSREDKSRSPWCQTGCCRARHCAPGRSSVRLGVREGERRLYNSRGRDARSGQGGPGALVARAGALASDPGYPPPAGGEAAVLWFPQWSPTLGLIQSAWTAPVPGVAGPRSFVAESGGRAVGLAQMRPLEEPRQWEVVFLAVELPQAAGRGRPMRGEGRRPCCSSPTGGRRISSASCAIPAWSWAQSGSWRGSRRGAGATSCSSRWASRPWCGSTTTFSPRTRRPGA